MRTVSITGNFLFNLIEVLVSPFGIYLRNLLGAIGIYLGYHRVLDPT